MLRALPTDPGASVLELAAGGGAVTRFLGETFASVDAWEPDSGLAEVAERRCADLPSTTVRCGWIEDVPPESTYDLVVALDVLGEIARHGGDLSAFVAWCRVRLAPRGMLVLGADNARGVRFLAGSPTPRRRDADPLRPARITRDDLQDVVEAQGLDATVLSAFPDHRDARVLFDHDALEALDPHLLSVLPSFPSPPYDGAPGRPHEGALWSAALQAGTARESSNGLVVLASSEPVAMEAVAAYWSQGRCAAMSAANSVVTRDGEAFVERSRTFPESPTGDSPLRLRPHTEPILRGTPMSEALVEMDDLAPAAELLRRWASLVASSIADGAPIPWDLIPRNVMVLPDGNLAPFDQEWELTTPMGQTEATDLVVTRGAFWLAYDLLFEHGRPAWLLGDTMGQVADFLLRLVRPTTPARWVEAFAEHEATLMSYIWPVPAGRTRSSTTRRERKNVTALSNTPSPGNDDTTDGPDGDLRGIVESLSTANADLRAENEALKIELRHAALAHRDDNMGLVAASEALKDRLERAHARNRRQKVRLLAAQRQVTALKASRTWRVGSAVLRPAAALRRRVRR